MSFGVALVMATLVAVNVGAGVWNLMDERPIGAANLAAAALLFTLSILSRD